MKIIVITGTIKELLKFKLRFMKAEIKHELKQYDLSIKDNHNLIADVECVKDPIFGDYVAKVTL